MEILLMWVGGVTGLITVAAMLWRWATGHCVEFHYDLTPVGIEQTQERAALLDLRNADAHGWPPAQKDELRQDLEWLTSMGHLRGVREDYHDLLPYIDQILHAVERQADIPSNTNTKPQSKERPRTAARAPSATGPEGAHPNEPPRAYRHLLRHLPPEARGHRKEMEDFLEDGIRDRTRDGKSTRGFVLSETLQLALFIGKVTIFKFRKSRRRTVT